MATQDALDPKRHALSQRESDRIYKEHILPEVLQGGNSSHSPHVCFLGGQPGSGKTSLAATLLESKSFFHISNDILRTSHPEWLKLLELDDETAAFYTNYDSRKWLRRSSDWLISSKWDVLVDGTMMNSSASGKLIEKYMRADYQVEVVFVAASPPISLLSNLERYVSLSGSKKYPARTCRRKTYNQACAGVLNSAQMVDDGRIPIHSAKVYCRRTGQFIYDSGSGPPFHSVAHITREQRRTWNSLESWDFISRYSTLRQELNSRDIKWEAWFQDIKEMARPLIPPRDFNFPS